MRTPLLIALVVYLMAYNLKAEYLAYDWTVGEWPNEIGLQGITNWDGKTYFTKICFGGWRPNLTIQAHVFLVVSVLVLPIPVSLLLFSAKNRRNRQTAQQ